MKNKVDVWEEKINLPTYGVGKPEKNPMFLENRVYQGSSGVVYPYPVIEKIKDECHEATYQAIWMENEYLKIMILPELGGRIQMAYDKIKKRHFIYYNHVIKPALVGLTGPWISGGIEFNWPQHHRPSTFLPVNYTIEKKEDGTAIVWVSERERMFGQKGSAGFTLRPGKAVLEIQGKVANPTPLPQTFLWWANPAVKVNDEYQSVFPSDVNAVFDHGKRDVSRYPIATGTYYKMDYSAGVDISRYKNIPVPTSYMAIQSKFDFVGGYENDTKAGLLHVANHHFSPGKKQWTWGNGDFGQAWDRNLTDNDGPYIELMTGVYTDNQPDFTWLQPYEEKTFVQYFMPYRELGVVKNATADLIMNIEKEQQHYSLKVFATSHQDDLHIVVKKKEQIYLEVKENLSPEKVFSRRVELDNLKDVNVKIKNAKGKTLLAWEQGPDVIKEVPEAAQAALPPDEIQSNEDLYLTGIHLEQYRHATYHATDYYLEALRRNKKDARCNNAMGVFYVRKGQFVKAEAYLRQAIKTLTQRNPNPYDSEPYYNLGLCLKYQGKYEEAYNAFYKACWNAAWQDAGYFSLAQLSCIMNQWENALEEIDKSLLKNWHNMRARHLKSYILRKLNQKEKAVKWIEDSLTIDAFNFGCQFENYLLTADEKKLSRIKKTLTRGACDYENLIMDYISVEDYSSVLKIAQIALEENLEDATMLFYYKSWALLKLSRYSEAKESIKSAEQHPKDCCFPNALEAIAVLTDCAKFDKAPKALYLLGNLWYDKRQYEEAINAWETSMKLNDKNPTVFRNLALAYFNKKKDAKQALILLEKAFSLNTNDARILMELDQFYKLINKSAEERFSFLNQHKETAFTRDDLYLEYITLLNELERYDDAILLLNNRKFHPWEGGEGKVSYQYQIAHLEKAKEEILKENQTKALEYLDACYQYPHNLGEGKLQGAQENDFDYYKGIILLALGEKEKSAMFFKKASCGLSEPAPAIYYYDQKPDKIFYQGLALLQRGKIDEAKGRFNRLINYGEKHLFDNFKKDYFAVSLPDLLIWESDMDEKNKVHCYYLMALGYLGLKHYQKANSFFKIANAMDNNHQGIKIHTKLSSQNYNSLLP